MRYLLQFPHLLNWQKATSGVYKTFADSLRAHPENYAFTRPDLEKRIFSYETAYLGV